MSDFSSSTKIIDKDLKLLYKNYQKINIVFSS